MLSSQTKDKIYVSVSITLIILVIVSLAMAVNFFIKINRTLFSVNEKLIKERTTTADIAGYNQLKEKLEMSRE